MSPGKERFLLLENVHEKCGVILAMLLVSKHFLKRKKDEMTGSLPGMIRPQRALYYKSYLSTVQKKIISLKFRYPKTSSTISAPPGSEASSCLAGRVARFRQKAVL
jgi:hypothetical protein